MLTGKLRRLEELCASLGVHTRPARVGGVWVVPLLSWYHASFDAEPDIEGARPVDQVRAAARAPWSCCGSPTACWAVLRICKQALLKLMGGNL